MGIIRRDYLDDYERQRAPVPFPRDLAAAIARKADHLARQFEAQATQQLVREARRALENGAAPEAVIQQLGL